MQRLRLNFKLQTAEERTKFTETYLQQPEFIANPPTPEELEMIGNYILWGKNEDSGLSIVDEKLVEIETRNKTWTRNPPESIEGLLAEPTFIEASLRPLSTPAPRTQRRVFSREEALKNAPSYLVDDLKALFAQIDYLDLCIGFYEFECGKRAEPPRKPLRDKFTEDQLQQAIAKTQSWNQYKYLKCRHLLVELRRQQFTMRDSYTNPITRHIWDFDDSAPTTLDFDSEINVRPVGLKTSHPLQSALFTQLDFLNPFVQKEPLITYGVKTYWKRHDSASPIQFDFRELEDVYGLLMQVQEVDGTSAPLTSNLQALLDTLGFYISEAGLSDAQREILDLKTHHYKNQDIAEYINKKYHKNYTTNYISTIFRQKIIPKINEAARIHGMAVQELCFEESFKKCSCCGKILLRAPEFFTRKARAKDGFANRCKVCDKETRQRKGGDF